MQNQNVISIDYLENPARFADLLNGYVYHGQEIVKIEDIRELNSSVPRISRKKKQINAQVVTADIVREVTVRMKAIIVALENQTDIHLLEVRKYKNLEYFHTDLKYVFGFLQKEKSKDELKKYVQEHSDEFEHLCEDAYDMISVMSHSSELLAYKHENISNKGGANMCQAILEMIEDGRQEGREEGIKVLVECCQELGISKDDATLKIQEKYKLTEEQANEKIALYWMDGGKVEQ